MVQYDGISAGDAKESRMTPALAQRLIALAGIALLAALLAISLKPSTSHEAHLPRSIPAPGGGWYTDLMAPNGTAFRAPRSCGLVLGAQSLGLSSEVYPCRTKIWLHLAGEDVLTQVIARSAPPPGATFELSPALARKIGVSGTQEVRWRFAARS
jgi:hypothetical protein